MTAEVVREETKEIRFDSMLLVNHLIRCSHFSISKLSIRIIMNVVILVLLGVTCFAIYVVVENVERRDVMDRNFEEAIKQGIDGVWLFILSFQVNGNTSIV